jgi:Family of unknown function (DUF5681)
MVKGAPPNQAADVQPQNRRGNRRGKRQLHPAMIAYQFKPGQSGNPGGRPRRKPLTDMLISFWAGFKAIWSGPFDAKFIG